MQEATHNRLYRGSKMTTNFMHAYHLVQGTAGARPYISNVHKVTNKTEGSLMIRKAKTSDGGEYTCKASNPLGFHNASFRLSVLGKYEVFSS